MAVFIRAQFSPLTKCVRATNLPEEHLSSLKTLTFCCGEFILSVWLVGSVSGKKTLLRRDES